MPRRHSNSGLISESFVRRYGKLGQKKFGTSAALNGRRVAGFFYLETPEIIIRGRETERRVRDAWSPVNACKFGAATGSDWPHKSLGEWNRASLRLVGRVFILRPLFCARAERAASLELRRSRVDTSTTLLSPPASVDLDRAESCTENGSWPAVKPPPRKWGRRF